MVLSCVHIVHLCQCHNDVTLTLLWGFFVVDFSVEVVMNVYFKYCSKIRVSEVRSGIY